MVNYRKYLNPRVLNRIARLDLKARFVVEGFIAGLHRSPYRGVSVDFAEHREYVPGDDIRFIDWKVYAKSDRFYVKEFEEETNLTCHIFLDASESMSYGSMQSEPGQEAALIRKFDYATWTAAALSHLLLHQRDSVSLVLFKDGADTLLPPRNGRGQLHNILEVLEAAQPDGSTAIARSIQDTADRINRRGIAVIISDFFDEIEQIVAALKRLRARGHEVILFHVLDADEIDFPFGRMTRFEGLEGLPHQLVNPKSIRQAYQREIQAFTEELRRVCRLHMVDYVSARTDASLEKCLVAYLGKRASRRRARK